MDLIIIPVTLTILALAYYLFRGPDPKLPPFPVRPLPVVGNLLHFESNPRPLFKKWADKCGDIFSVYMASSLVVVLNGYDLISEAFVKKADYFSDRPPFIIDKMTGLQGKGVILLSGDHWKEQRSVTVSYLRMFGMGKNELTERIRDEISYYVDYLASLQGKPSNIRSMTTISNSNIICSIILGQRFQYTDEQFLDITTKLNTLLIQQQTVSIINFLPWLQILPGDLFGARKLSLLANDILQKIKKFVNDKKQNGVDFEGAQNFIEAYCADMSRKIKAGTPSCMDEDNLVKLIYELFVAGTETTSSAVYWSVLYAMRRPDIQDRLHRELDEVVGTGRTPDMRDMPKLIYLNAFTMEVLRLTSLIPLFISHMCAADTTLRGYTIPKGTFIIPNADSVMHDRTVWGDDALDFRPDRFIDANGVLTNPKELIPFGIGRRICLGESMARMTLFLFLSTMFQRFDFLPPNPDCLPSIQPVFGIVVAPPPYEVKILERNRH